MRWRILFRRGERRSENDEPQCRCNDVGSLQRLALQQPRHFTREPRGLPDEQAFQRRRAIDQAQPDVTHGAQQRRLVGKKQVQRIGGEPHRHGVEPPPALVAVEHVGLPDIDTEPGRIDDYLGKRGDVLQAHIEPLPRDRVNHMGGVADQRQPLADKGAGDEIAERKRARFVERVDLAEMQAKVAFKFAVKLVFVQANDARGLAAFLGPYQRRPPSCQRQNRKRTCGKEMLFGAAVMVALVPDRHHDAGLIIVPAMGGDAGTFAQFRARAVGRDQQARLDLPAVRQCHVDSVGAGDKISYRGGREFDAFGFRARNQHVDQIAVFDHMREGFAGFDIARKGQEHRAGGVVQLGVGDDHVENRLCLACDRLPCADRIEQPAACRHNCGRARIAARPRGQRWVGHDYGNVRAEALTQRQGERQARQRTAGDHYASLIHAVLLTDSLLPQYSWAKQVRETRGFNVDCHGGATHLRMSHLPLGNRKLGETESAPMSNGLIDLISILDLEPLEVNLFRGNSPKTSWQRVFGGQVIGQAMVAACRTVEGRLPHSLHCYFILPGDPQIPIIYQVERLRDGKSYSTRRVTAIQHGNAIFSIMVSFHAEEESAFDHQDKMPDVPPPEKLTAEEVAKQPMFKEMPDFIRRYYESDRPIELRPVELGRYFGEKIDDGRIHVWIRTAAKLPDDPALHMCALAYASDFSLLDAIMARYGRTLFDKRMMPASLDHAMWFHRPFRADEWLLYAQDSPSAQDGRGLTRGLIFKPDGTLVASVAQEGSVRERKS